MTAESFKHGSVGTMAPATAERALVLTRILNAPRLLVFKAWTDPKHLARWWGPMWFTNPVCETDARPGGAIRIHMRAPDGTIYPMSGTYHDFVEPTRLVFTSVPLDGAGDPLFEVLNVVTFDEQNGHTKVTLRASVVTATPDATRYLDGMDEGWIQSLDRLKAYVTEL